MKVQKKLPKYIYIFFNLIYIFFLISPDKKHDYSHQTIHSENLIKKNHANLI